MPLLSPLFTLIHNALTCPVFFTQRHPFNGQAALQKRNAEDAPTIKQLIQMTVNLDDIHTDVWPWGMEPIYYNGMLVGSTTSTSYKPSSGKVRCFGMIEEENTVSKVDEEDLMYEIDINGKTYSAQRIVKIVFN